MLILFIFYFLEVQWIYNVVLISGIHQSDSLWFVRGLTIVPCAIQQELVIDLFYVQQFVSANPKLLIYPFLPLSSLVSLFSTSVSLFLFCKLAYLYYFFRFHIETISYIFLSLTYFTQYNHLLVQPCCFKWQYFILCYG